MPRATEPRNTAPSVLLRAVAPPHAAVHSCTPISETAHRKAMLTYQNDLYDRAWKAHERGGNTVAVCEGRDAAGEGGAIRRVTQAMDARLFRVITSAAPTDEEKAQHYLWRF